MTAKKVKHQAEVEDVEEESHLEEQEPVEEPKTETKKETTPTKGTAVFAELDAFTAQARKNQVAQDEAEATVTKLAGELIDAKGDLPKETELSTHISTIIGLMNGSDYTVKLVEWTKVLADSEHALKAAGNTAEVSLKKS